MDFVVQLPLTGHGHDAILVFVDKLTKMAHFVATKTTCDSAEAAQLFLTHVFRLHGLPIQMLHDRGPQFMSNFWTEFFKLCGVQQVASTAFHPQTDGQTERVNGVLEDYLRHFVNEYQNDWDGYLSFAEFAYNNAIQDSTGQSPFKLNYGFDLLTPMSYISESHRATQKLLTQQVKECSCPQAATNFSKYMEHTMKVAKTSLVKAQDRQKSYADTKRRPLSFTVGDKVLLSTKNLKLRSSGSRKLLPRFIGPFTITQEINPVAFKLDLPSGLRIHNVFHISLLKPYLDGTHFGSYKSPPFPSIIDGELEYEVESIKAHRLAQVQRRGHEYLVHWKGYSDADNTWEPESNLTNCKDLLTAYKSSNDL
jgi:hypothetical protein